MATRTTTTTTTTTTTARGRILIADDTERYLTLFRRLLPPDLVRVFVTNGEDALARLTSESESFDVLVSDVRMPGADGVTILERVRTSEIDVEVVLTTTYATIPHAVQCMKVGGGGVEYLTKPFEPAAARAAIERALARKRDRQGMGQGHRLLEKKGLTLMTYREVLAVGRERATREYIIALLRELQGNVAQAAERAGIERESFGRLLKTCSIRAEDYQNALGGNGVP